MVVGFQVQAIVLVEGIQEIVTVVEIQKQNNKNLALDSVMWNIDFHRDFDAMFGFLFSPSFTSRLWNGEI